MAVIPEKKIDTLRKPEIQHDFEWAGSEILEKLPLYLETLKFLDTRFTVSQWIMDIFWRSKFNLGVYVRCLILESDIQKITKIAVSSHSLPKTIEFFLRPFARPLEFRSSQPRLFF